MQEHCRFVYVWLRWRLCQDGRRPSLQRFRWMSRGLYQAGQVFFHLYLSMPRIEIFKRKKTQKSFFQSRTQTFAAHQENVRIRWARLLASVLWDTNPLITSLLALISMNALKMKESAKMGFASIRKEEWFANARKDSPWVQMEWSASTRGKTSAMTILQKVFSFLLNLVQYSDTKLPPPLISAVTP